MILAPLARALPGLRTLTLCALATALASHAVAQSTLLVSGFNSDTVHMFDPSSGTPSGTWGAIPGAHSIRYGPDGRVYVCSEKTNRVLRHDGQTGAFIDVFIADDPLTPEDETGGLDGPTAAVFGPDGALYVASFNTDRVLRYDGTTGAFVSIFVVPGAEVLNGPDAGMDFGPDGNLYIPSYFNRRVLRFNGQTGVFMDAFVSNAEGGVRNPRTLRFRSDGLLYVSSEGSNQILRYDLNGVFIDAFITVAAPTGFAFGPDDGDVYVSSITTNTVERFDGLTGAHVATIVPAGGGGLDGPVFLEFFPDPQVRLQRPTPAQTGVINHIELTGATPSMLVSFDFGSIASSEQLPFAPQFWTGIQAPRVIHVQADAQGRAAVDFRIPALLAGQKRFFQAIDLATSRVSNLVVATIQ